MTPGCQRPVGQELTVAFLERAIAAVKFGRAGEAAGWIRAAARELSSPSLEIGDAE
jgi:hypothetical protein